MRRGWQALCIGLGIQVLLFGIGILTRTPQIPGHPPVLSPLRFFGMPGFVFELLVADSTHITWSLHPDWLRAVSLAGNILFYSAVAFFVLWLRAARRVNQAEVRSEQETAWFRTLFMRRVWLALAIGLTVTVIAHAILRMNFDRPIPNGEGGVTYTDAHPYRFYLVLPGMALMILAINVTPVMWGSHPVLAQLLVGSGNFLFYSAAAYVVLRLTAGLSARWKHT